VTPEKTLSIRTADTKISDTELPELIERTWNDAGWTAKDLTHVACITGPGGFMSLKVGAATANALAWGLGIPMCGIHLSGLYAARAVPPLPKSGRGVGGEGLLWIHSTKKDELFVRGFGMYASVFPDPVHLTLAAFEGHLSGPFRFMGELIPEHDAWLHAKGGQRAELHPLEDILPSFLGAQTYDMQTVQPWYGREG
jgi:hypothetical protein